MNYGGDGSGSDCPVFHGRHGTHVTDQREHCKESGGADRSGDEGSEKTRGKTNLLRMLKEQRAMKFFHHSS